MALIEVFLAFIEQYWIWIVVGIICLEIIVYLTKKRRRYRLFPNYSQQMYPIYFQEQQFSPPSNVMQQFSPDLQQNQYNMNQMQVQNQYPVFVWRWWCRRRRRRGRRFWF